MTQNFDGWDFLLVFLIYITICWAILRIVDKGREDEDEN